MKCFPAHLYYGRIAAQIKPNFARHKLETFTVTPSTVKTGDIVELNSDVLGIVSFCGLDKFDVVDLDNNKHVSTLEDLRFSLRTEEPVQISQLVDMASHSKALVPVLQPYAPVLYSFFAQENRTNAFDFGKACDIILRSKYKSDPKKTAEQVLAIYFMLSHSPRFQRLQGSPFAAKPTSPTPNKNPFRAALGPSRQSIGPGIRYTNPDTKAFPVASFYTSDIGFSLETKYDRFQVNIYLPLIPWRSPMKSLGSRGMSIKDFPLVEYPLRRKFGLQRQKQVSCLVISALVNPWNNKIVDRSVELGNAYGQFIPQDFFMHNSLFDRKRHEELGNLKDVFAAHAPDPQRCDFEKSLVRKEPLLARQARHLASVWGGEWAAQKGIDLCWLRKERLKSFEDIADENAVETEVLTSTPGPYEQLDVPFYAPLGFVFDSSISATNAGALAMHLVPQKPFSLQHLPQEPLSEVYRTHALPNKQFIDRVFELGRKYDVFRELTPDKPVFFRCTVLDSCTPGGIVKASCNEMKFTVDVKAQVALEKGDSVVCTKVLDVDPARPYLLLE